MAKIIEKPDWYQEEFQQMENVTKDGKWRKESILVYYLKNWKRQQNIKYFFANH